MNKRNKIIYWVATLWLALGTLSTGIVQLIKVQKEVENFDHLGYPNYLLPMLGVLKIIAVIVLLLPKLPLLKEWAYAGLFFTFSGAAASHIISQDPIAATIPLFLLLALTLLSWHFRPLNRKAILIHT